MSKSPQFSTAEYQETLDKNSCKTCSQPIRQQYFRVNGAITCVSCAMQAADGVNADGGGTFAKAMLFGVGGALLGLILYSAVGIITGLEIGYVSIAVGYLVGRAIMMGSSGVGGRRYQIAALLLTYAAVSLSAVPIGLHQLSKQKQQPQSVGVVSAEATPKVEKTANTTANTTPEPLSFSGLVVALGVLAFYGLASPILGLAEPLQGLIGLVILFVGLRIAWKLTVGTRVPVMGPYNI